LRKILFFLKKQKDCLSLLKTRTCLFFQKIFFRFLFFMDTDTFFFRAPFLGRIFLEKKQKMFAQMRTCFYQKNSPKTRCLEKNKVSIKKKWGKYFFKKKKKTRLRAKKVFRFFKKKNIFLKKKKDL
jgi:hypothetical protein